MTVCMGHASWRSVYMYKYVFGWLTSVACLLFSRGFLYSVFQLAQGVICSLHCSKLHTSKFINSMNKNTYVIHTEDCCNKMLQWFTLNSSHWRALVTANMRWTTHSILKLQHFFQFFHTLTKLAKQSSCTCYHYANRLNVFAHNLP